MRSIDATYKHQQLSAEYPACLQTYLAIAQGLGRGHVAACWLASSLTTYLVHVYQKALVARVWRAAFNIRGLCDREITWQQ